MAELRQRRSEGRVGWTEYYSWIRRLLQEDPAEVGEKGGGWVMFEDTCADGRESIERPATRCLDESREAMV